MNIQFATKDRAGGLIFMQKSLPEYDINATSAKVILDMVDKGKIRIGDPVMYPDKTPIYPGDNYSPPDREIIIKWMNNLLKKPVEKIQ